MKKKLKQAPKIFLTNFKVSRKTVPAAATWAQPVLFMILMNYLNWYIINVHTLFLPICNNPVVCSTNLLNACKFVNIQIQMQSMTQLRHTTSRSVRWSHVFYSCTSFVLLRATLLAFVAPTSSRLSQLRSLAPVCLGSPENCKLPSRSRDVILRESSELKKEIRKYVSLASIELKLSWP